MITTSGLFRFPRDKKRPHANVPRYPNLARLWVGITLSLILALSAKGGNTTSSDFRIDFLCCGEKINPWDPGYSNAVVKAIFPHFKRFAKKLGLPEPSLAEIKSGGPQNIRKYKDDIRGGIQLHDGTLFSFQDGHVTGYESPDCYTSLQDYSRYDKALGPLRMTKEQAVEFARKAIRKLGYSLEDVWANYEPFVRPLEGSGTNTLPRYRIVWSAPSAGGGNTEIEVNARDKKIESIRFNYIVALKRPSPKVDVEPGPLIPTNSWLRLWIWENDQGSTINHEYAYRLVPVVFKAAEDWVRKFNWDLTLPIRSNQVRRFYCSNNGGVPYVEMTLKNHWRFTYRVDRITYAGSPRRLFECDDSVPLRVKAFVGKWNLTEEQAIELARQAVAKMGYSLESLHMDVKPRVTRPREVKGMPTIPRLWLQWRYPGPEKPAQQSIEVEVDCDKGTVEALQFNDVRFGNNAPDLGVPIDPQKQ